MMRLRLLLFLMCLGTVSAETVPRVVSLSPSLTEIVFRLNGEKSLVGRSRVCDFPAEAKNIPIAGEMGQPHLETLLATRPDVIVCDNLFPGPGWEYLKQTGIRIEIFSTARISDYSDTVRRLGKILNKEREAKREIDSFNTALEELRKNRPPKPMPIFIVLGVNPLVTCGKGTFVTELIRLAGGENIAGTSRSGYFIVSAEFLLAHPPEAVLVTGMEGALPELEKIPGWKTLPAVVQKRLISGLPPSLCCRLGPRTPEAIRTIRRAMNFQ